MGDALTGGTAAPSPTIVAACVAAVGAADSSTGGATFCATGAAPGPTRGGGGGLTKGGVAKDAAVTAGCVLTVLGIGVIGALVVELDTGEVGASPLPSTKIMVNPSSRMVSHACRG